ncbi:MAG: hypothetical protein FJ291_24140, partial [Planctomycetes bacterium]|nr:hypothetical protein [Planctomycetota bacterium]
RTGIYTLSDETLKLLMEVKKPLRVISTMVRAARADSEEERPRNFIRGKVGELLEEYQSQSRQIEYIPLDIYANPEAADRLRKELKTDLLADSVTFAYGSGRDAKTKVVEFSEVLAQASPYSRQPPQFKGEDAFTSALQTLLEEKSTKVCFVIGHGEHGIVDYEPVGPGLSAIVERVKGDNCEVKSVTLPEIPDDCDVLVIAGPKMAFRPDEVDAVRNYLTNRQGAGLIVMLDPIGGGNQPSGLEPLLHEHMIEVRTQESIVDIGRQRIGIFVQEGPSLTIECTEYGGGPPMGFGPPSQHQIVRDLKTMRTTFHVACPVASTAPPRPSPYGGPPQGDPFTHELVKTSAQAFSKVDFDPGNIGRLRMDGDKDRNGPFALAIARGLGKGQQPPMQPPMGPPPPQGKIVAFGDSDFISNMYIQRGADGNSTLFRNAIAWAAGKEYKIGIKAKPFHQEAELELPSRQRDFAWWAIVFAPPFHILVIGLVVWWIRRR